MEKNILLKFAFLPVFSLWTTIGYTQENKTKVSVNSTEYNGIELFQLHDTGKKSESQTVELEGSNLTPYRLEDWDDMIVVSTFTETSTSASTIYDNQTIYLDFAILNNGTEDITQTFITELYIDDIVAVTISATELNSYYYKYMTDLNIGTLSAGTHTFRIVVDAKGDVTETDESDNEYARTITVTATACANVAPYQRTGWDDKIVLSTVPGTNSSASIINDNQIIYLDWALNNNGTCDIAEFFNAKVYVDDVLIYTANIEGLESGYSAFKTDLDVGTLSAGKHTFKIVADSQNDVTETNETDNEYTRTITITAAACANVSPFQPSGWDDKIVVSTVTGTNTTSASTIYDNQNIYLDWAFDNNGTCKISETFYTKVFVDDVLKSTYSTEGIESGYYAYGADLDIGTLAAGNHSFRILVDADSDVTETNESDNEYTRTITVIAAACGNVSPYLPPGWDDKIVLSTKTGTNISASAIYDNQIIYLDWAIDNNGTCDISATVITKVYVDDVIKATYNTKDLKADYYSYLNDLEIGLLSSGTHTFRIVADANNSVSETDEIDNEYTRTITVLSSASDIESFENLTEIKVYPNPVSEALVIELKGNKERINFVIINSAGEIICRSEFLERTIVQTANLNPGFYLIKFNNGKSSGFKKILKE